MKTYAILSMLLVALSFSVAEMVNAQSVTVTKRTVTYTRKKPMGDHKKTFIINYPELKGVSAVVAQKIKAPLDYFKLFDFKLAEELNNMQWLEEADFEVKFAEKGILSVAMWIEGSAAYPDGVTKYVNVNTKTGSKIASASMFTDQPGLAFEVSKKMQAAIQEAIKVIKEDKENDDLTEAALFGEHKFTVASLNNYFISAEGVTFVYEYNFPHVIQALEPDNEYAMTWKELAPFIRRDGLLAGFIR